MPPPWATAIADAAGDLTTMQLAALFVEIYQAGLNTGRAVAVGYQHEAGRAEQDLPGLDDREIHRRRKLMARDIGKSIGELVEMDAARLPSAVVEAFAATETMKAPDFLSIAVEAPARDAGGIPAEVATDEAMKPVSLHGDIVVTVEAGDLETVDDAAGKKVRIVLDGAVVRRVVVDEVGKRHAARAESLEFRRGALRRVLVEIEAKTVKVEATK